MIGVSMHNETNLPLELMPRERLIRDPGATTLSDAELLALMLKTGSAGCSVLELAFRLLSAFRSLEEFVNADWLAMKSRITEYNKTHPLRQIKGVGESKLLGIAAAFEFVRRASSRQEWDFRRQNLRSSSAAYRVFDRIVKVVPEKEHFFVLPMDSDYHPLCEPLDISQGSVNRTPVHPRDVFCEAVRYRAYAIIVAHNHPCGDPTPSEEDLLITKKLIEAGRLMGIRLLDHIVIGSPDSNKGTGFVSVRNLAELEF